MPHYVLQLKRTARTPEGGFAVYSTIVDNLITAPMSAKEMRSWLEEHEYTSWLSKDGTSVETLIEQYGENVGRQIHEMQESSKEWYSWCEGEGFMYARESDAYFCLPRSLWRND